MASISIGMEPPPHYVCGRCKASGVKLIREEFVDELRLRCHACASFERSRSRESWYPAIPDGPEGLRILNRVVEGSRRNQEIWRNGLLWWESLPYKTISATEEVA